MKYKRTQERRFVLEALYAWHMFPKDIPELIENVSVLREKRIKMSSYVKNVLKSVTDNVEMLDNIIKRYLNNWEFNRVAPIDIALLRLALAEFIFFEDIPPEVTINEIIELSKNYGTHHAPKFINGILDRALKDLHKEGKIHKNQGIWAKEKKD